MGTRTYENFDLLIEADGAGQYRARVTHCPVGDTAASVFSLPFSPTELENLLLKLDPGRSGMRRIADRHTQASIDLGSGLFDAVFRNEVLVAWSRSKDAVRQDGRGLRLRLRLTGAPTLAAMPWELLYDKASRMFYAQSDRTPVVRYLDVTNPPRPLTVRGPLRILAIIASPHGLPRLDVEREWATICDALSNKQRAQLVSIDRLAAPTIGELQRWLRHNEVHVLHFVGHGYFDDRSQDGMLMFTDPGGYPVPVSSAVLGTHVRDHDPLRLVVLNACQTARVDDTDPYSGMAQGLIQQEAAAVVAMQFPISDDAAIVFTREFYGAVTDGEPLDQAIASARKALLAEHAAEWATPVLFLRAADGRVFDRVKNPVPPAASPAPLAPANPRTEAWPTDWPDIQQVPTAAGIDAHPPSPPRPTSWESHDMPLNPPVLTEPRHQPPASHGSPRRRRRRYWIGTAAVAVIAALSVGILITRSHRSTGSALDGQALASHQSPGSGADGRAQASPASVVAALYQAINQKDWAQARRLWPGIANGSEPDAQIGRGFTNTRQDYLTITSTQGNKVLVLLTAVETGGGAQIFHDHYRVKNGVIVLGKGPRRPRTVPVQQAVFSTFAGKWLGNYRTLSISPEGLGIGQFRVFRSCTRNPSPPCDSGSGNHIYPGGAIIFYLTYQADNHAEGYIFDSSVRGLIGRLITITFQPSVDRITLTTARRGAAVSYCGPRAQAGLCGA